MIEESKSNTKYQSFNLHKCYEDLKKLIIKFNSILILFKKMYLIPL